ncbi:MAG: MFS transporter, partial [Theionarchaea archaeon]|nr:MFS transporter [Theionarchaea archaeon]MBU7039999.1 MFS transporter [Theionarchaea archaeon]
WMVYLLDRGFSYSVIGLALAVNGGLMAVLEVPTGALADAISRKFSIISGLVGYGLVLLAIPSITGPSTLVLVFALWALPMTLLSGAGEAWVVDNLKAENREDLIKEFFAKDISIQNMGTIFAGLIAGVVVRFLGMDALWYLQGFIVFISISVLALQKEHFERKKVRVVESIIETCNNIRDGARFTMRERNVFFIMAAVFFVSVSSQIMTVCSKPFLEIMGVAREYFGYLSAVGAALCVVMPFLAKYAAELLKREQYYLSLHALGSGLVLVLVLLVRTPGMAGIIFVFMILRYTTYDPVLEPFFQGFLPPKLRATVASLRNMVLSMAVLLGDCLISAFADMAGPQLMLAAGGLFFLPSVLLFWMVKGSPPASSQSG